MRCYDKTETVMLAAIDDLWEPLGPDTTVRVIIARDDTRAHSQQVAVITTQLETTPVQTLERYTDRWPIEVCFEHGKQLFGSATPATAPPKPSSGLSPSNS